MFFKKKNLSPDVVILINEREIRELPVDDENEEAISAGGLSLPKADAEVRYFPSGGRAFIYGCTPAYLAECENVARLEQSPRSCETSLTTAQRERPLISNSM